MSLIIAIEPDREQANQLKDLVRRHTRAELILADTTEGAIGAIEQRVPDLVLIPAFLSPQDDEALTAALRVREAAAHVQTLTIPVLGGPDPKANQQGVLARLLRDQPRSASPDGCDPKVFADQITAYLERVAHERGPVKAAAAPTGKNGDGRKNATNAPKNAKPRQPVLERVPDVRPAATAAFEAAHAEVFVEEPKPAEAPPTPMKAAAAPAPAEEFDGLEEGLSSLMEKLSAEDWSGPEAAPAPELDLTTSLEEQKVAPKPVTRHWPEKLRQLESREYAMPAIIPRDAETAPAVDEVVAVVPPTTVVDPAPPPALPVEQPAKKAASEWGDLLDSLQQELKR